MLTRSFPVSRCASVDPHPVDPELGLASEHDLLGKDVRAAGLDVHVEPDLLVVTLRFRRVVPGELRLHDPLDWSVTFVSPWPWLAPAIASPAATAIAVTRTAVAAKSTYVSSCALLGSTRILPDRWMPTQREPHRQRERRA